ncbi:MAG: corrinoid protein [Opitutaceae bacterium]|nr:corrinoid protein [Opitutaceae bacterium]
MPDLKLLHDAVLNGDAKVARTVTEEALAAGAEPVRLVQDYMMPAMAEVGRRFESGECFVPELLLSARAMKTALAILRPLLVTTGVPPVGRVIIGTVQGDLHDIGKNLVASVLEGGGFEVIDLGTDVSPEAFLAGVREKKPHIVALSALLTTTMPAMRTTIEALEEAGVRREIKVLVGGAPITQRFSDEIGADGYSDSATGAVRLAHDLLGV